MKKIILSSVLSGILGISIFLNSFLSDEINSEKGKSNLIQQKLDYFSKNLEAQELIKDESKKNIFRFKKEKIAKEEMIDFFDINRKKYNLSLMKHFYIEEDKAYMLISFRADYKTNIFDLYYDGGFIKFTQFSLREGYFVGEFLIIQPIEVNQ